VHCTLNPIIAEGYVAFNAARLKVTAVELLTVVFATKFTISAIKNDFVGLPS